MSLSPLGNAPGAVKGSLWGMHTSELRLHISGLRPGTGAPPVAALGGTEPGASRTRAVGQACSTHTGE